MKNAKSCLHFGHRLCCLVALLLMSCLAMAADMERQLVSSGAARSVADVAVPGVVGEYLLSWSLDKHDFDCLKDQHACDTDGLQKQWLGAHVTRNPVEMRPCIVSSKAALAQAADGVALSGSGVVLNAELVAASQISEIPVCYFEFLGDIQQVDYPAPELLWQALKAKLSLAGTNNIQRKKLVEVLERNQVTRINAALLQKLSAESSIWALLESLEGKQFDSTAALLHDLDALFIKLSERFEQYRPLVLAQARKVHRFDSASTLEWSGETCRCAQRELSGEVYGFMPFWLAGERHVIDSGVQTRLGYYAVGFDDQGVIIHDERWHGMDTDFIHQFRANGGKLDMVVYRDDWVSWSQASQEQRKASFAKLAANIVKQIEIPRTDLFSRLKPIISLGLTARPVMGDGVTLYFDHYPQDRQSVEIFAQFLNDLSDQLKPGKRDYTLNLMFGSAEAGRGIYDYQKLSERMDRINSNNTNLKVLLLVLLQEPTTHEKKRLRQNIENTLHGEQRKSLLRHVVTILSFDGHSKDQLNDDIIYAKDNFGGIGFWMQADVANNNEAHSAVSAALQENYLDIGKGGSNSVICKLTCLNR